MENYPKTVHRLKKSNLRLTVLVNENTLRFNDHQSGGTTVNKGPTCTDGRGGQSVQVQFPHLKISTLTTDREWTQWHDAIGWVGS